MNVMATYLELLGFNAVISVITFAAIWASRRKGRELTFLRGTAVLLISWVIGSTLVLIVRLLFYIGGTEVRDGLFESASILVVISVMYAVYGWLSKKRTVVVP